MANTPANTTAGASEQAEALRYKASEDLFNGERLLLYIDGRPIAYCKKFDLDFSVDQTDVTTKNSGGFEEKLGGKVSWTYSVEALVSMGAGHLSSDLLRQYAGAKKAIAFEECVLTSTEEGGKRKLNKGKVIRKGYVVITSIKESSAVGEKESFSATLTGSGPLMDGAGNEVGSDAALQALIQ